MKARASILVVVIGLVAIYAAVAQEREREPEIRRPGPATGGDVHHHYYGGGGPGYGYGYANGYAPQRGFSGGLASGVGDARLSTSEASENYAQTAHMNQENHNYAVNSYYANRNQHDAYVAAHRKKGLTSAEIIKQNKALEPGRLSNAQFDRTTNVIHWPPLLRDSEFTRERHALDHLFHVRTPDNSGAASDSYVEIQKECDAMMKTLGAKLRKDKLPAVTFTVCEHFIKSLAYEGRFAAK